MSWSEKSCQARIIKTILGMSNIRNGGWIVIGKEEQNGTFLQRGMTREDFDSYNSDHVKTIVNNYADPYAIIDLEKKEFEGRLFVIVRVYGFLSDHISSSLYIVFNSTYSSTWNHSGFKNLLWRAC